MRPLSGSPRSRLAPRMSTGLSFRMHSSWALISRSHHARGRVVLEAAAGSSPLRPLSSGGTRPWKSEAPIRQLVYRTVRPKAPNGLVQEAVARLDLRRGHTGGAQLLHDVSHRDGIRMMPLDHLHHLQAASFWGARLSPSCGRRRHGGSLPDKLTDRSERSFDLSGDNPFQPLLDDGAHLRDQLVNVIRAAHHNATPRIPDRRAACTLPKASGFLNSSSSLLHALGNLEK